MLRICCVLLCCLVLAWGEEGDGGPVPDEPPAPPARQELVEAAIAVLDAADADPQAALAALTPADAVPITAIRAGGDVINHLYWHERDLANSMAVGSGILDWGLERIEALPASAADERAEARGALQALAYKLARFTWIGDNQRGLTITAADRLAGLGAARINLELVRLIHEPEDSVFTRAYWLLGAHLLAAGESERAEEVIARAEEHAALSRSEEEILLAVGLQAIGDLLRDPEDADAAARYADAIASLDAFKGGISFTGQLERAKRSLEALHAEADEAEADGTESD